MPYPTLLHSSLPIVVMPIGITQVQIVPITLVGSQKRQYMILVRLVGVSLMEEAAESGQRHWVHLHHIPEHTTVPTMATSLHPATTIGLTGVGAVASKNNLI